MPTSGPSFARTRVSNRKKIEKLSDLLAADLLGSKRDRQSFQDGYTRRYYGFSHILILVDKSV